MDERRTIRVAAMTRVEGEGGLSIHLREGVVMGVELRIFEPPRLFEALLRDKALEQAPDITARICGICPIAYQLSAVQALEQALGITIPPPLSQLRRLLYCGEWIESHTLHVHLLHAPDFFNCDSGLELAKSQPEAIQRGLQLRKHGNRLLEVLGGRAIHPVNVAVGGFYRLPRRAELAALVDDFAWGLEAAVGAARWVAGFEFPDFQQSYDFVSLWHPDEYPLCAGAIRTSDGLLLDVNEFEQHFVERQVPHSTALQAVRRATGGTYLVGPLARLNHCRAQLAPVARALADELGLPSPSRNPYQGIVARSLEVVHAYEEALAILRDYRPDSEPRVRYEPRAGRGCAATEAPRGLLYHSYEIDRDGLIKRATIVPPTSQNQARIEEDLRHYLPQVLTLPEDEVALACERLVRSYDPCISCSTHFLKVNWVRQ